MIIFLLISGTACKITKIGVVNITAEETYKMISNDKNIFLLDVRTPEEYNDTHIADAVNISLSELEKKLNEIPKNRPLIVYCLSGTRSSEASKIIINNGFKTVFNMEGGITAWEEKSYPVVKSKNSTILDTNSTDTEAKAGTSFLTLSIDEAYKIFTDIKNNKDYIFIDVRSVDEYKGGHIQGAINLPLDELESKLSGLPKDKKLIVYCNGSACSRSAQAAEILISHGFKEVFDIGGRGIDEWKEKGYPFIVGK